MVVVFFLDLLLVIEEEVLLANEIFRRAPSFEFFIYLLLVALSCIFFTEGDFGKSSWSSPKRLPSFLLLLLAVDVEKWFPAPAVIVLTEGGDTFVCSFTVLIKLW